MFGTESWLVDQNCKLRVKNNKTKQKQKKTRPKRSPVEGESKWPLDVHSQKKILRKKLTLESDAIEETSNFQVEIKKIVWKTWNRTLLVHRCF